MLPENIPQSNFFGFIYNTIIQNILMTLMV